MRVGTFIVALVFAGTEARAADAPAQVFVPAPAPVLVEHRLLVKESRWFFALGLGWLARGDYYDNPGLSASIAYWPIESTAVELRVSYFRSSLNGPAQALFDQKGLLPDSQQPSTRLMAGIRRDLAYGKLALAGSVVHFDFQLGLHAGTLITTESATPALDLSAGLLVRISRRWFAQLDVAAMASYENRVRSSSLALGVLPELSMGFSL
jgi:outer membrane beta-barrel protein